MHGFAVPDWVGYFFGDSVDCDSNLPSTMSNICGTVTDNDRKLVSEQHLTLETSSCVINKHLRHKIHFNATLIDIDRLRREVASTYGQVLTYESLLYQKIADRKVVILRGVESGSIKLDATFQKKISTTQSTLKRFERDLGFWKNGFQLLYSDLVDTINKYDEIKTDIFNLNNEIGEVEIPDTGTASVAAASFDLVTGSSIQLARDKNKYKKRLERYARDLQETYVNLKRLITSFNSELLSLSNGTVYRVIGATRKVLDFKKIISDLDELASPSSDDPFLVIQKLASDQFIKSQVKIKILNSEKPIQLVHFDSSKNFDLDEGLNKSSATAPTAKTVGTTFEHSRPLQTQVPITSTSTTSNTLVQSDHSDHNNHKQQQSTKENNAVDIMDYALIDDSNLHQTELNNNNNNNNEDNTNNGHIGLERQSEVELVERLSSVLDDAMIPQALVPLIDYIDNCKSLYLRTPVIENRIAIEIAKYSKESDLSADIKELLDSLVGSMLTFEVLQNQAEVNIDNIQEEITRVTRYLNNLESLDSSEKSEVDFNIEANLQTLIGRLENRLKLSTA